jgi:hypothetical protein
VKRASRTSACFMPPHLARLGGLRLMRPPSAMGCHWQDASKMARFDETERHLASKLRLKRATEFGPSSHKTNLGSAICGYLWIVGSLPAVLEHTIHLTSGHPLSNAFSETYSRMAAGLGPAARERATRTWTNSRPNRDFPHSRAHFPHCPRGYRLRSWRNWWAVLESNQRPGLRITQGGPHQGPPQPSSSWNPLGV